MNEHPPVNPEYLMTDEELQALYQSQANAPTAEMNTFGVAMGALLNSLLSEGFSKPVAEQIVLASLKHSLGGRP